jgi:hypothetical protein
MKTMAKTKTVRAKSKECARFGHRYAIELGRCPECKRAKDRRRRENFTEAEYQRQLAYVRAWNRRNPDKKAEITRRWSQEKKAA